MMKTRNIKILTIFLILLCCFMGAASAADDVSIDAVDASVDDAVIADAVIDDTDDSTIVEETPVDTISDDTAAEEIDEETQTDEISEESAIVDSEPTRASSVTVTNWSDLSSECTGSTPKTIYLSGAISCTSTITFGNSATIIGNPNSYITGGKSSIMAFVSSGDYSITFKNVTFKNMKASVLIKMSTTGVNKFINCSFNNIHTYAYKSSVIWNDGGLMNIIGCNFTNCNDGFGVITNYATTGTATMTVENCRFENNYGRVEPGAINNCGIMNVTNCTFTNNTSYQWAGGIHTHSGAETIIVNSTFTNNNAGWNGGALYSYSKLQVINSTFTNNTCNSSAGGGAIGCSNYGSSYNITVSNCNFTDNANLCGHTNETPSTGTGGAISAMNNGILNVYNSTFVHNVAAFGQAIAAYSQGYISPEGNISAGIPKVIICDNSFYNHTLTTSDTVELSGDYTFENNTFTNCHQANNTNNIFINPVLSINPDNPISQEISNSKTRNLLTSADLADNEYYIVNEEDVNIDDFQQTVVNAHDQAPEEQDILIYLPSATFIDTFKIDTNLWNNHNYFFVSREKDKTIFDGRLEYIMGMTPGWDDDNTMTFINITFKSLPRVELSNHKVFINCTFIDCGIIANNETYFMYLGAPENVMGVTQSLVTNFTDCLFVNTTITSLMFSQTNFENCIFKDIVADSLVNTNTDGGREDGVYMANCTFENVTVKGIIDYSTNNEVLYSIEDCDYDFAATVGAVPSDDNSHYYLNATKLAKPKTTLVADIDDVGNLLVNLTAGGSAVANGKVLISVNGGEAVSHDLGEDGTLSIALADLTDATGKLNIAVTFEETDDYKGSTASVSAVVVVKAPVRTETVIDYQNMTTTAVDTKADGRIGEYFIITLKDKNGNALANKPVQIGFNGVVYDRVTDENGTARLQINLKAAGTYTFAVAYLGDDQYNGSFIVAKITVNKQKGTLTVPAKTYKASAATKTLTATFKSAKGGLVAGKKVTFTVNGKTYTATTNDKGVATVKVSLNKKGTYSFTAKFAGDNQYAAISKTAKLTIK